MKTEHLKIILKNYLLENKTQYAILINGKWGSGKTYYWKNELVSIAENEGYKTIYISLNGISSIKSLEQSLFYKLIPFFGKNKNGYLKDLSKVIGNSANAVSKFFFKSDLNDIFKGVGLETFPFDKYVICFDDLERCQIPIKETLGFINTYTEHRFLKTIVLADEKNIDSSQKGYNNIKEKVIGRILNFELDIKEAVSELIAKFKDSNIEYFIFLKLHENHIANIFIDFKLNNLRIITFSLKTLENLFLIIKNIDEQFIREIIFFVAIISIEFKNGKIKSTEYDNPKGIQHIDKHFPHLFDLNKEIEMGTSIIVDEKKEKKEKSFERIFYDTYLTDRINDYFFYSSIYTFVLSGYLDETKLALEIKNRYPEIISDEIKNFRQLLNYKFRELSNSAFDNLSKKVLEFAKEGKYSLYDYVQIANFYYYFIDAKLIDLSIQDINKTIDKGLDLVKSRKEINDTMIANLMHFGDSDNRITEIKKKINAIHNEVKKENDKDEANNLIDIIKKNDEVVLIEYFTTRKFSKTVFKYLNTKELCSTIVNSSNKQIFNLTEILNERYNIGNIGEHLFDDYQTLIDLTNCISEKIKNSKSLKKYLLDELEKALITATDKLLITKK